MAFLFPCFCSINPLSNVETGHGIGPQNWQKKVRLQHSPVSALFYPYRPKYQWSHLYSKGKIAFAVFIPLAVAYQTSSSLKKAINLGGTFHSYCVSNVKCFTLRIRTLKLWEAWASLYPVIITQTGNSWQQQSDRDI
ncbi:hypothetical protein NC652_033158 [Populus alba x Populus x berolinensis]|nr:hypothetical protein NC652_033158 [Populus alba x Populus x berolinensis]